MKVRRLQHGRPTASDLKRLNRIHSAALDWIRRLADGSMIAVENLGVADNRVAVVKSDPTWSVAYENAAAQIRAAASNSSILLHHIGSTAVPGLAAKPIIDILVVVPEATATVEIQSIIRSLSPVGYKYYGNWGHRGGHYLGLSGPDGLRTAAIQLHRAGEPDIELVLGFRNLLRTKPEFLDEYSRTKCALAKEFPSDRGNYFWTKSHYVHNLLLRGAGHVEWGKWFFYAQYPTLFQLAWRSARLGPLQWLGGQRLHPMAISGGP